MHLAQDGAGSAMEAVLSRPARPQRSDAARAFQNWLLCWILLPNLGFCLLWIVGGPPRAFEIILTGAVGIVLHRAPFLVKFLGFAAVMAYSLFRYISGLFNLSIMSLLDATRFAAELNPLMSPQYVFASVWLLVTHLLAWRLLRASTQLYRPALLIAALALTIAMAQIEAWATAGSVGSYKRMPVADAPFTSAVNESGFKALATGDRHLVLIMVESMGLPTNTIMKRQLEDIWARPEVRRRYDVTSGDTLYYGSTTSGEIRELCGRWSDYQQLPPSGDPSCLPAMLARSGYRSQAWHSFTGEFFDRTDWYPRIGFTDMRFGDALLADGALMCPGVFPGACDRHVPAQIAKALKTARQPQFLYWLTVGSHLPVMKHERLGTQQCASFDARLDREFPMICRLHQIFDQTGRALAAEISAEDFPEADILIVGDHIPPFFDRHHRTQFAPDRVPWILLRAKRAPEAI